MSISKCLGAVFKYCWSVFSVVDDKGNSGRRINPFTYEEADGPNKPISFTYALEG